MCSKNFDIGDRVVARDDLTNVFIVDVVNDNGTLVGSNGREYNEGDLVSYSPTLASLTC